MMVTKMNPNQIIKFVELYKVCDCLWDRNSPEYKNRNERNRALNLISEEMKITGFGAKEVTHKINFIRTAYKQELRKIKRSKLKAKSSDEIYKSKLPWFDVADSFLRLFYSIPNPQNSSTSLISNDEDSKDGIRQIITVTTQDKVEASPSEECLTKRRRLNCEEPPRTSSFIFESTPGVRKSASKQSNTETEFDHWTRSLAIQLNSMDVIRALKLQLKMQTLLSNERLEYETTRRDQASQSSTDAIVNGNIQDRSPGLVRIRSISTTDDSDTMSSMFSLTNEDVS